MKIVSLSLIILFGCLSLPAKKKQVVGRPASKPPVYKKFDNRKKKQTQTVHWGNAKK